MGSLLKTLRQFMVLMQRQNLLTSLVLKYLLKLTEKLSELSTRLQSKVLHRMLLTLVHSTLTSTQTEDGLLRSSRVYSSRWKETQTQSHRELVGERVTSSFAPLMLLLH